MEVKTYTPVRGMIICVSGGEYVLKEDYERLTAELAATQEALRNQMTCVGELKADNARLQEQSDDFLTKWNNAEVEVKRLTAEVERLEKAYDNLLHGYEITKADKESFYKDCERLEANNTRLTAELKESGNNLDLQVNKNDELTAENQELSNKVASLILSVFSRTDKIKELEAILKEVCEAAIRYDDAIRQCADDPEKMASFCTAEGENLDLLYADWMSKSRLAIKNINEVKNG